MDISKVARSGEPGRPWSSCCEIGSRNLPAAKIDVKRHDDLMTTPASCGLI